MRKKIISIFAIAIITMGAVDAQTLPGGIRKYLNANYRGWKLSPSYCGGGGVINNGIASGNFDNGRKRDYAVKFTRGKRGFILAFLARRTGYAPFVLHRTDADDLKNTYVHVLRKGKEIKLADQDVYGRYDAPAHFRCESDVGAIHLYRNGKFVATEP